MLHTVGFQQIHQIGHLGMKAPALVGLGNLHAVVDLFDDVLITLDVLILVDCVVLAGKGLVGHDPEIAGGENQGIARDAGGGLVGLAEAAVDDDQLAAALDGALTLLGLHRHMAVDNMAVGAFQAEFLQKHLHHSGNTIALLQAQTGRAYPVS